MKRKINRMKRQHPTDPNLFWCPKCKTYKNKNEFYSNKSLFWGISSECVECIKKDSKSGFRKQALIRSAIKNYEKIKERKRISAKHEYATDPSKIKTRNAKYTKKLRHELADRYVKEKLKNSKKYICQYTIELKRQQIIAKRTLKEFKQWRKEQENEPDYTNVYGEQHADEENHEGRV
jgi:hypothetical protein